MEYVKVDSSQIAEVGYGEGLYGPETLGIIFQPSKKQKEEELPGSTYHYGGAGRNEYDSLLGNSAGVFYGMTPSAVFKIIKSNPDKYPFTKVEADPTLPAVAKASPTNGTSETLKPKNSAQPSVDSDGDVANGTGSIDTPSPGTALALIDGMADDKLFSPGSITDAQLATMRSDWLAEAKKHDISTDAKRTALKRFARPLQKLRTGIEARAKELTGATKRKIAAIDTEKRRLVQVVGGIEDEVLAPLSAWEAEEEARKVRLANVIKEIEAKCDFFSYHDIESLQAAIAEVEAFDVSTMQEYKVSAESAVTAVLKRLKPELERRKVAEAERVELDRLRAESAARAETDRQAEAKRREDERIAAAVEAAKVATRQEVIAELAAPVVEEEPPAGFSAEDFFPLGSKLAAEEEPERVPTPVFSRPVETHGQMVNREAVAGLMGNCYIDRHKAIQVLTAITKGLIPHISITY